VRRNAFDRDGFSIRTIAALVKRGLVTVGREKVRAGGKWIDAAKVFVWASKSARVANMRAAQSPAGFQASHT